MEVETVKKITRTFQGIVVSDKMDKTIVVRVDHIKADPKYKKRYQVSRNFKVHDAKNECKTGELVSFAACRPYSKDKCWRVVKNKQVSSK